tara:strand:+ start:50 stop:658 length:609 start_codon:yes stop_codon:yes gene_type:complete
MFYRQRKYFQFLLKSSNQHGVHSPFVYQLVTKCLYKKIDKNSWKTFQKSNNELLKNKKIKNSHKKAKILLKLIHYFKPKNNLEITRSLDLAVIKHAMNSRNTCVTTIANTPTEISEVTLNRKFDCIYFHKNQITLKTFNTCLKTINNNSFFIFNDIYESSETIKNWSSIKNHPKVKVSLDLFYFGVIFFRKEQAKEHFKIRV